MTFGKYPDVSPARARERHAQQRSILAEGIDPIGRCETRSEGLGDHGTQIAAIEYIAASQVDNAKWKALFDYSDRVEGVETAH